MMLLDLNMFLRDKHCKSQLHLENIFLLHKSDRMKSQHLNIVLRDMKYKILLHYSNIFLPGNYHKKSHLQPKKSLQNKYYMKKTLLYSNIAQLDN